MKNYDYDISSLFSSLSSNSSNNIFDSINLGDYMSIKDGSYGKLVKSYYAEQKKSSTDSSKKTNEKTTNNLDTSGLTKMKGEADELKESLSKLNDANLYNSADKSKLVDGIKDFANKYNDVIEQSAKVSSKEVSQSMSYMKSMTSTMSKALSKVGITVETDGKLSVDDDKLNNADISSIKTLFNGSTSYGSQIIDKASEVSKNALAGNSLYSSSGQLESTLSSLFNIGV